MLNSRVSFLFLIIFAVGGLTAWAQNGRSISNPIPGRDASNRQEEPLAPYDTIRETKAKLRRKAESEAHEKFVARGEEAVRLTAELKKSFESRGQLAPTDLGKLEQLEKTLKRIRKTLGGDDEETSDALPATPAEAVNRLSEHAATLRDELKKTTMYTISADAIDISNEMLEIIAFIRGPGR